MMKLDAFLPPTTPTEIPRLAEAAEEIGFDGLWIGETSHDSLLAATLAAEHTERLEVGTAISLAFSKSPMALAYTAWDVQALARGRFILGLGSQVKGHMERRFAVPWVPPRPKMREVILALRAIWAAWQDGEALDFQGQHYSLNLMTPFFDPGPIDHPEIPIYLAAVNPGMAELAGELCQGIHVHPLHTGDYLQEVLRPAVTRGARRARRPPEEVVFATSAFVVTGRTEQEVARARDFVRQQVAFYASTRTYRPVLDFHEWSSLGARLHRLSLEGKWGEMGSHVPDDVVSHFAVEAPYDELPEALRTKYRGLSDRVSLYLPFDGEQDWWPQFVGEMRR